MQASRYGQTATQLTTGKVRVAGGMSTLGWRIARSFTRRQARLSLWLSDDECRTRVSHTATLLNDGTVLVAGGSDLTDEETLDTAEIYNPAAGPSRCCRIL